MSHEIEVVEGKARYAGRKPAWHGLGTVIKDLDYSGAMEHAGLGGWNVRAVPLVADVDGQVVNVENSQLIVRDVPDTDDVEALGTVGGGYRAIQNEQAFAIVEFLESLGATVETAASIRGGRQVFMTVGMEQGFVLDPEGAGDRTQGYLLLTTSHDGSLSIEASSTWVRVVCANTLDYALPRSTRAYKIRHTTNADVRLAEAQQIFIMAQKHGEDLAEEAFALYQTESTDKDFFEIVNRLYPKPGTPESGKKESKRGLTVWGNKVDTLTSLYKGKTNENIADTVWAAQAAAIEYMDWYRTARGGDGSSLAIAATGLTAAVTAEKQRIRQVTVDFAREKNPDAFAYA